MELHVPRPGSISHCIFQSESSEQWTEILQSMFQAYSMQGKKKKQRERGANNKLISRQLIISE